MLTNIFTATLVHIQSFMRRGFTLIELLIVIGIIATLASVTIVAIGPTRQIVQAQDRVRQSAANQLQKALQQYQIDNKGDLPNNTTFPAGIGSALPVCKPGVSNASCFVLDGANGLVPTYIAQIPVDAADPCGNSGYSVYKTSNGRPAVIAVNLGRTFTTCLRTNLLSYWNLEEASGIRKDMIGTNDLTENVALPNATGISGNAAGFTAASTQTLRNINPATLQLSNVDFTTVGWIYFSAATVNGMWGKGNSGNGNLLNQEWSLIEVTSRVNFNIGNGVSATTTVSSVPLVTGQWYFVAAWWDKAAQRAYVSVNNGTADSIANLTGPAANGWEYSTGRTVDHFLDGRIDSVGVWNRLLTPAELTWLYNNGNGRSAGEL